MNKENDREKIQKNLMRAHEEIYESPYKEFKKMTNEGLTAPRTKISFLSAER
jgi:hypothetical protein